MSKKTPSASKANAPEQPVKKEKKAACRLFSLLFLLVSAAALILLPFGVLSLTESTHLYEAVMSLFTNGFYTATTGILNTVYNISI